MDHPATTETESGMSPSAGGMGGRGTGGGAGTGGRHALQRSFVSLDYSI